jgi:hypothetical protein
MSKANGKAKKPPTKPVFTVDEMKLLKSVLDQKPPIVELPISALNVDMSYQDRPRERIVHQVESNFSEALLGIFKVSRRPDGSYWVCDGESRRQGILRRGEKQRVVRCEIFELEGPKQEALLFAWFNSRRSKEPTKLETNLQAYGIAGTDHGFAKAVQDCGFTLVRGGKRHLRGPGYAVQAWDLDGDGTAMRKALFALKDSWRDLYEIHGYMVLGVARLYHYSRKTIDEQVRRILHRMPPNKIMDLVSRRWAKAGNKAPRIHPDDKPKLISRVLADEINKNPGKSGRIDILKLDESRIGA